MRCMWGSYYNIPKAIFYLLKGDYKLLGCGRVWGVEAFLAPFTPSVVFVLAGKLGIG